MQENWFGYPRTFCGLEGALANADDARVLVLPVPYDSTTTYRTGAREGPQAIIDASVNMELFDLELTREISDVGIHTLPEVMPVMAGPQQMTERLYAIAKELVARDKLLVSLGGEHSLTPPLVQAFTERYPNLSVLYFDAHADLRDAYEETRFSHACAARRVVEMCPVVQAGIRSLSQEEWEFLKTKPRVTTFYAEEFPLSAERIEQLVDALTDDVYISIDLDVLDPSIMLGVGTPEPGGLTWNDALSVLRRVAQHRHIVGFDLMEYCPPEGNTASAFTAAKLAYKLMGYATHEWTKG